MQNGIERFNLRVYAIIVNNGRVLLSDENMGGYEFTKFPGGGVELGEGLIEALKRELIEEGNLVVESVEHFYTTDFFQASAFKSSEQIVSVYYKVEAEVPWNEYTSDQSNNQRHHLVKLYFKPLSELNPELLTFPIDKKVLEWLKKEAGTNNDSGVQME